MVALQILFGVWRANLRKILINFSLKFQIYACGCKCSSGCDNDKSRCYHVFCKLPNGVLLVYSRDISGAVRTQLYTEGYVLLAFMFEAEANNAKTGHEG